MRSLCQYTTQRIARNVKGTCRNARKHDVECRTRKFQSVSALFKLKSIAKQAAERSQIRGSFVGKIGGGRLPARAGTASDPQNDDGQHKIDDLAWINVAQIYEVTEKDRRIVINGQI